MMRSLFSGVTGLQSHQTRMDVIGNNIANVNTMGFKKSSVTFKDLYSETISAASAATGTGAGTTGGINAKQIGLGAQVNSVTVVHTAGSAQYTGRPMDVAISGDGYFVVETPEGIMYTRAGNFSTDQAGNLVTQGGHYVLTVPAIQKAVEMFTTKGVNASTMVNSATGIQAPAGNVIQQGTPTADLSTVEGRELSFRYEISATEPWTASMQAANIMPGVHQKPNSGVIIAADAWTRAALENAVEQAAALNAETATTGDLVPSFKQVAGTADPNVRDTIEFNAGGLNLGSYTIQGTNDTDVPPMLTGASVTLPDTPVQDDTVVISDGQNSVTFSYDDQANAWTTTSNQLGDWTVSLQNTGELVFNTTNMNAAKPNLTADVAFGGGSLTKAVVNGGTYTAGMEAGKMGLAAGDTLEISFNGFTLKVTNNTTSHWDIETAAQQITNALNETTPFPTITLEQNGEWSLWDDLDNKLDTVTVATTEAAGGGITGDFLISTTEFGNFSLSLGSQVVANEAELAKRLADSTFSVPVESEWGVEYSSPGSVLAESLQTLRVDFDLYGELAIDATGAVVAQLDQDVQVTVDGQLINLKAGDKVTLGYVALANFNNPSGLEKVGDNLYTQSANSGDPAFNMPGTGNAGALAPSNLEMSNVDLSEEIVNMIITQRGFQANSRIITTTDTMLEELVNLKR